ncbi:hypothetical protein [Pseudomonas sp. R5-89-07]|uniref:hypothetical protein n=1 Tax=Pseudomonas sp. R5-89-07 TaxID=658644 RepID=UPI000F5753CA|nr:hypothetical protein [Pseudomonas sp. R5-89-07]AZF06691.1 hypothetical protein C4J94_3940 [Pseudomonas sp. R5-89-07]
MPIDSSHYSSHSNNYSDRYGDKYQSIAPQTSSTQGSWRQSSSSSNSSTPLVSNLPYSTMGPSNRQQFDQANTTKAALEKLPTDFPTPALPKTAYQAPINLLEQRIKNLEARSETSNPLTKLSHYREDKKTDKAFNKEMVTLYKQARDVQTNGTNQTDKNRASNVTDQLTVLGKGQPWLEQVRKENRKGGVLNWPNDPGHLLRAI